MPLEKWVVGVLILVFLVLITFPFIYTTFTADSSHVFGGFLLNPIDGNSYLAKMREGYDGAWRFTLPYTAEPGAGAAINLYYLFLGHVALWLGLSLLVVFHAARLLGALLLCLALYRLFAEVFSQPGPRLWAFGLTLFGSGLGWLALAFGGFTSDFWVAEAYPFLAAYTNAHFPLGLALQIGLLTPLSSKFEVLQAVLIAAGAALLSIMYPFGWMVAVVVLGAWLLWQAAHHIQFTGELSRFLCTLFAGFPYALYSFWIVNSHSVLRQWTQQNLTLAPAPSDLIAAFSPALILSVAGAYFAWRKKNQPFLFLAIWLLAGLLLVYTPGNLQRRSISGLYVPVGGLAVFALESLRRNERQFHNLALIVLLLSIPTNLLILLSGSQAARLQSPALYLQRAEMQAYQWLDENAAGALVLAAPDSGLFIPAYSDARVLYGHPFETPDAETRRAEVQRFYNGQLPGFAAENYLEARGVDYVFYGPRERALGSLPELSGWQAVYISGSVEIWGPAP